MIDLQYSNDCRHALALADYLAHEYDHAEVTGFHILCGLLKNQKNLVAIAVRSVLERNGRTFVGFRWRVDGQMQGTRFLRVLPARIPHSSEYKKIIRFAKDKAETEEAGFISSTHLMAGIYKADGQTCMLLERQGVTEARIGMFLAKLIPAVKM